MKIAIIGSRSLSINNLEEYIRKDASEIVSGRAIGIDTSAKNYALSNNIKFTEFLPKYNKYGKSAPLKRNIAIIQYSDYIIAFWNGKSKGTKFVIDNCKKLNTPIEIYKINI